MTTLNKKIQDLNELELYFLVEECGGFIWRMNHDMADGRIPESEHAGIDVEIENVKKFQMQAINELPRVGIVQPLDETGHGTDAYWAWYRKWNQWHHNMSDESWRAVNAVTAKGVTVEQVAQYRQEADELAAAAKAEREKREAKPALAEVSDGV